ncbi:hypothetical protein KDA23_05640 [Candidatus Saccharibacteria bacterium]|nr:hypothetical protein [Candidatus Saccharibacteria bacterium]
MKKTLPRLILALIMFAVLLPALKQHMAVKADTAVDACNKIVDDMALAVIECSDINSNTACYGATDANVHPTEYRFHNLRDRRDLKVISTIDTLYAGTVFLNLQVAGITEPIWAVLFGPVHLDTVEPGTHDFLMQINNDDLLCSATPPGMIVRTESGETGLLRLNGVEIKLQSSAFITVNRDKVTSIVNLEGNVTVSAGGESVDLPVGFQVQVRLVGGQPQLILPPVRSSYYDSPVLQWLVTDEAGLRSLHNTNEQPTALACVNTIDFGETITEYSTNPEQECLFQFCANAGDVATVSMDAVNPALDTWLDLRLPDKNLLAFNNDISEQDTNSLICNVELPVTSCDYTIVARSHRNRTAGAFELTLDGRTSCIPPVPRCDIMTRFGAYLYEGPGVDFQRIRKLPAETHLRPERYSDDREWIEVQLTDTDGKGWVKNDSRFVECENPVSAPPPPCPPALNRQYALSESDSRTVSPLPAPCPSN